MRTGFYHRICTETGPSTNDPVADVRKTNSAFRNLPFDKCDFSHFSVFDRPFREKRTADCGQRDRPGDCPAIGSQSRMVGCK